MRSTLIKPIITEKMTNISQDLKQYGFLVNVDANKVQIAEEIEKKYKVHVTSVNTINHPGKIKSQFRKSGRFEGRTAKFKKAIVSLKEGETIELFEQV